jgi:hypothetical protein
LSCIALTSLAYLHKLAFPTLAYLPCRGFRILSIRRALTRLEIMPCLSALPCLALRSLAYLTCYVLTKLAYLLTLPYIRYTIWPAMPCLD